MIKYQSFTDENEPGLINDFDEFLSGNQAGENTDKCDSSDFYFNKNQELSNLNNKMVMQKLESCENHETGKRILLDGVKNFQKTPYNLK